MKRNLILAIVTALLLLLGIIGCIAVNNKSGGCIAVIRQNGNEVQRIDLSAVSDRYSITLRGENGEENVIFIEHGAISMHSASCPDKLCVKRGKLSTNGIPLVCLPNHIVIEIVGDASQIDAVTY